MPRTMSAVTATGILPGIEAPKLPGFKGAALPAPPLLLPFLQVALAFACLRSYPRVLADRPNDLSAIATS